MFTVNLRNEKINLTQLRKTIPIPVKKIKANEFRPFEKLVEPDESSDN